MVHVSEPKKLGAIISTGLVLSAGYVAGSILSYCRSGSVSWVAARCRRAGVLDFSCSSVRRSCGNSHSFGGGRLRRNENPTAPVKSSLMANTDPNGDGRLINCSLYKGLKRST